MQRDHPVFVDALSALERYAKAFDDISAESDAHYSARSFVRWLKLEVTAPDGHERSTADVGRAFEAA